MTGNWLKILLIVQFLTLAAVPCQCVVKQLGLLQAGSSAGDCCRNGSCQANITMQAEDRATVDEMQIGSRQPRNAACPGCLLPDLAPPPPAPADDVRTIAPAPTLFVAAMIGSVLDGIRIARSSQDLVHKPTRSGDESLLRLRCALIV